MKIDFKALWKWSVPIWPLLAGGFLILCAAAAEHGQFLAFWIPGSKSIFDVYVPLRWLSELGYAFVIAWVVSAAIEARAKREHERSVTEARQNIAKDVVQAVYEIGHPKEYVETVIKNLMGQKCIRRDFELSYRIDPFPIENGIDHERFVLMTLDLKYNVKNVSATPADMKTGILIPCRPGPLKKFCVPVSMTATSKTRAQKILDFRGTDVLEIETESDDPNHRDFTKKVELAPGEEMAVAMTATFVKELSDSETFGFAGPAMGLTLRLALNVPRLQFGMRERTTSSTDEKDISADGRSGYWKINGPILPRNSIVIWWRVPEDSGLPETEMEAKPITETPGNLNATGPLNGDVQQ